MTARRASLAALALVLTGCPKSNEPTTASDSAPAASSAAPAPSTPMNATPLPSASVAAALNPEHLPPYDGPTGSVEGTVYVTGDPAPSVSEDFSKCPDAVKTYGKLFREGPANAAGARPLADALVGVTGYTGFYIPERNEAKLAVIKDCAYTQRTIDLTFGQRLDVANKTNLMVAPSLVGAISPALMVAPPNGEPVHLYPHKPGYYRLVDRFDATPLRADVYVLLHPLHAVTDTQGHFRIDGVPVGSKLTVFTRHLSIGEAAKEVAVLSGVVSNVELTLTFHAAKDAGAPAPKDGGQPILK